MLGKLHAQVEGDDDDVTWGGLGWLRCGESIQRWHVRQVAADVSARVSLQVDEDRPAGGRTHAALGGTAGTAGSAGSTPEGISGFRAHSGRLALFSSL